jgi:hypothetical protein
LVSWNQRWLTKRPTLCSFSWCSMMCRELTACPVLCLAWIFALYAFHTFVCGVLRDVMRKVRRWRIGHNELESRWSQSLVDLKSR